jgi:hypothetical protein
MSSHDYTLYIAPVKAKQGKTTAAGAAATNTTTTII